MKSKEQTKKRSLWGTRIRGSRTGVAKFHSKQWLKKPIGKKLTNKQRKQLCKKLGLVRVL